MTLSQTYNSLCPPAKLYLVIQSVAILLLFIQNLRDTHTYSVGSYKIPLGHHNVYYFLVKIFVLATWTWLLNKLCSKHYEGVAWFLVLIPFILFFVGIGMVVVSGLHKSNQLGPQATNYQPVYMSQQAPPQAPPHTVLAGGHTASCQCPKCPPPPVIAGGGGAGRPPGHQPATHCLRAGRAGNPKLLCSTSRASNYPTAILCSINS